MKIFLLLIIVCLFVYIGYGIKNSLKAREKLLKEIILFLKKLESEIDFLQTNLIAFVKKYKTDNKNFIYVLNLFEVYMVNGKTEELKTKINNCNLKEDEKEQLVNFFINVGKNEASSEVHKIKNHLIFFELKLNQTIEHNLKYCPLAIKLSILASLALCVILA